MRFQLCILGLTFFASFTLVQSNLLTVECNAKLPSGRGYVGLVHDTSDPEYIFILGGYNGQSSFNTVLRYHIRSDTIEQFGSGLPNFLRGGTTALDSSGNIYYMGGTGPGVGSDSDVVYVVDSNDSTQISNPVGHLPQPNYGSSSVQLGNVSYIFWGWLDKRQITTFNVESHESERVGMIEYPSTYFTEAKVDGVIETGSDSILIFACFTQISGKLCNIVTKYNTTTGENQFIQTDLPARSAQQNVMVVGANTDRYAYLIGNYYDGDSTSNSHYFIKYDKERHTWENLVVDNFMAQGSIHYNDGSAIHVPIWNRIYFFGGWTFDWDNFDSRLHDKIWYVQLQ